MAIAGGRVHVVSLRARGALVQVSSVGDAVLLSVEGACSAVQVVAQRASQALVLVEFMINTVGQCLFTARAISMSEVAGRASFALVLARFQDLAVVDTWQFAGVYDHELADSALFAVVGVLSVLGAVGNGVNCARSGADSGVIRFTVGALVHV